MIIVAVDVVFGEDPTEVEGIRDAFRVMEEETRKETGCLKYVSSVDIHDSTIVRIYELWESMEALEPHFKTLHMADFQKALGGVQTKSMEAKVYEVSKELPFPN
jgi:quinol monooxygenase YgiN